MIRQIQLALSAFVVALAFSACDGGDTTVIERTEGPAQTAAPRVEVTGVFSEPRAGAAVMPRALPPAPEMFPIPDQESAVIYDIVNRRAIDLGRGSLGTFSPNGAMYAWIADPAADGSGELRVIELATEEQRALGEAQSAIFVDEATVLVSGALTDRELVDVYNSTRRTEADGGSQQPNVSEIETPSGYLLRRISNDRMQPFELVNPATGNVLLRFDAMTASPAGEDAILMATQPVDADMANNAGGGGPEDTTNLFLIDIESGAATFVATARGLLDGPAFSLPMAASQDFVAWTPFYCGIASTGRTHLYERASGGISQLDASLFVGFTEEGMLTDDIGFGVQRIIDPRTLEHVAVIPLSDDIVWSEDYAYAAQGLTFAGHGGNCP